MYKLLKHINNMQSKIFKMYYIHFYLKIHDPCAVNDTTVQMKLVLNHTK